MPTDAKHSRPGDELSCVNSGGSVKHLARIQNAIRIERAPQIAKHAHLGFAFTEPLAWKPLGEALAYAAGLGLHATVTTNGLLLPRRIRATRSS